MKAIEQRGYGDPRVVLQLTDVKVPDITVEQVLVRLRASSAIRTTGTWSAVSRW
jgi:NADPH:quinone reductase-like Zn-dependent oxidoreductase